MAWTEHGHQIPNSPVEKPEPTSRARCGGPTMCLQCKDDALKYILEPPKIAASKFNKVAGSEFTEDMFSSSQRQLRAISIVTSYVESHLDLTDEKPAFEVYIVWFAKTLQNWKALLSTTLPDGMYYEITYNGDKREVYLDAYKKFDNVLIKD